MSSDIDKHKDREEAAAVLTQYLLLTHDGKSVFNELHKQLAHLSQPSTPWTNTISALFSSVSSPVQQQQQQRSDPPLMVVKPAAHVTTATPEEKKEEHSSEDELSEQSLDERCVNVCDLAPGKECACRYTLTDTENNVPELDLNAVAIFFPNRDHSCMEEDELVNYVKEQSKSKSSSIASMDAYTGRYYKGKWVIPYVVVYFKSHKRAVHFYTLMRNTIAKNSLPISLNWGRKRH